jgi:hypothetical protein
MDDPNNEGCCKQGISGAAERTRTRRVPGHSEFTLDKQYF